MHTRIHAYTHTHIHTYTHTHTRMDRWMRWWKLTDRWPDNRWTNRHTDRDTDRHDQNPRFSKSLSHLKIYYSRLTPIISRLLIVNTMYKLVKNGTGSTGTETSRFRFVGCLDFWSCLDMDTSRLKVNDRQKNEIDKQPDTMAGRKTNRQTDSRVLVKYIFSRIKFEITAKNRYEHRNWTRRFSKSQMLNFFSRRRKKKIGENVEEWGWFWR
jgi:hypothetical protein